MLAASAASPTPPPTTKESEYPTIPWQRLRDPDVQLATLIYNDRIYTWRRMKELDRILDTAPTSDSVSEMATLRERNLLCFDELQSFATTGKWLRLHPLAKDKSEYYNLVYLCRHLPDEFFRLRRCCEDNIRRYRSYLNRPARAHLRDSDRAALDRYTARLSLFTQASQSLQPQQ